MKRKPAKPAKKIYPQSYINQPGQCNINLLNLMQDGIWKDEAIVNLYMRIRRGIGAVRDDGLRRECDRMVRG